MNRLHVGYLIEEWRRRGIGMTVVDGCTLEVTSDLEQDINEIGPLIKAYKQEILAYLIDGADISTSELLRDARLVDSFPLVCRSCPRLELVDRGDEIMAGCLYLPTDPQFGYGWRRIPTSAADCMWINGGRTRG